MKPIIFLALTLMLGATSLQAEQYNAVYIDGIPNTLKYQDKRFSGSMGSIIKCIDNNAKIDVQYQANNISNALDGLANGNIDFVVAIIKADERDQYALSSHPILNLDAILLSKKSLKTDELSGEIVALARGSSYAEKLTMQGARIKYTDSYMGALQMLIDGHASSTVVPRALLAGNDISEADQFYDIIYTQDQIVFYVSNKAPNQDLLLTSLNTGINNCRIKK